MKVFLFDIGNVLCDFDYKNLLDTYKEISNKADIELQVDNRIMNIHIFWNHSNANL